MVRFKPGSVWLWSAILTKLQTKICLLENWIALSRETTHLLGWAAGEEAPAAAAALGVSILQTRLREASSKAHEHRRMAENWAERQQLSVFKGGVGAVINHNGPCKSGLERRGEAGGAGGKLALHRFLNDRKGCSDGPERLWQRGWQGDLEKAGEAGRGWREATLDSHSKTIFPRLTFWSSGAKGSPKACIT